MSRDQGSTWLPRNQGLGTPRIIALAIDPFDSNRLWVATFGGSLHRSDDAGETWQLLGSSLPRPDGNFVLLADPRRRNRLFALTATTLFRSETAGLAWRAARHGVSAAAFDSAGTLYVGEGDSVLRTRDGRTFRRVNRRPTGMSDPSFLVVHARRSNELWAADGPKVWRSLDGGVTWTERGKPSGQSIHHLVLHSQVGDVLYALAGFEVWKSRDAGATWKKLEVNTPRRALVGALAIDPSSPSNVLLGLFANRHRGGVFLSTDAGRTLRSISRGISAHALADFAVDPSDPRRIAAAVPIVGTFLTADGGKTWKLALSEVVANTPPSPLGAAFDPLVPGRIYVIDSNGLARTGDGGASWSIFPLPALACGCSWIEPDPAVTDRVYTGGFAGLYRSDDAGQSWITLQSHPLPRLITGADRVLVDAADPSHLVVDGFELTGPDPRIPQRDPRLIESFDDGETWVRIDESLPARPISIAAAPFDLDRFWVTTGPGLFRADGQGRWELINDSLVLSELRLNNDGFLFGLGFLRDNGSAQSVWLSRDAGRSWSDLRADLPFFPHDLEVAGKLVLVRAGGGGVYARTLPEP